MAKMLTLTVDLGFGRGFLTRSLPVLSDEELDARIAAYEAAEAKKQAMSVLNDSDHKPPACVTEGFVSAYQYCGYADEFEKEGQEEEQLALY